MDRKVYWLGVVENCDVCHHQIDKAFVDGRMASGHWACMCLDCYDRSGVGFGTGYGQLYEKQADGRWLKIAG